MKIFKYTVWIFLLFLLQTVVMNYIAPFGFRPDLILPFVAAAAIKEDSFKSATIVSVVCAAAAGALSGKNFSFCVLFYTYAGAMIFNMRRRPRYMPDFLRFLMWVVPTSIISEAVSYLLLYSSVKWFASAFVFHMLPTAGMTALFGAIIYFFVSKTLFGRKKIMGKLTIS
ncbi:MAG: hypothetical protein Q4G33_09120 [bacterium]|nr:hypothetical protein [bacterium]